MANYSYTYVGAYIVVPERDFEPWDFLIKNGLDEELYARWNFESEPITVLIPNKEDPKIKHYKTSKYDESFVEISSFDPEEQKKNLLEYAGVIGENWEVKFGIVNWSEW